MGVKVCSIEGCEKPVKARGWCEPHYDQFRERPSCSIDDCGKPVRKRGWCTGHYTRWLKHGSPSVVVRNVPRGPHAEKWGSDNIAYTSAHNRVRRAKGSAGKHQCEHCGGRARDWAYDHNDPGEKVGADGLPYSADSDRYIPLCLPCHRKFDKTVPYQSKENIA